MKKFFFLFLLASPIYAQETYTFTLSGTAENTKAAKTTNVGRVNLGRLQWNESVCARGSLPANCTQAQACEALNITGGAACTATDATAADARIYPDSLLGRQAFIQVIMVRKASEDYLRTQIAKDKLIADTFCQSANAAQLLALCVAYGNPECFVCGR